MFYKFFKIYKKTLIVSSLADMIVLGGCIGRKKVAKKVSYKINVPFTPGRIDATQKYTDIESSLYLNQKQMDLETIKNKNALLCQKNC